MNNNDQNNKREICRYLNNLKVVVLGVKSQAFKCFGLNYSLTVKLYINSFTQ